MLGSARALRSAASLRSCASFVSTGAAPAADSLSVTSVAARRTVHSAARTPLTRPAAALMTAQSRCLAPGTAVLRPFSSAAAAVAPAAATAAPAASAPAASAPDAPAPAHAPAPVPAAASSSSGSSSAGSSSSHAVEDAMRVALGLMEVFSHAFIATPPPASAATTPSSTTAASLGAAAPVQGSVPGYDGYAAGPLSRTASFIGVNSRLFSLAMDTHAAHSAAPSPFSAAGAAGAAAAAAADDYNTPAPDAATAARRIGAQIGAAAAAAAPAAPAAAAEVAEAAAAFAAKAARAAADALTGGAASAAAAGGPVAAGAGAGAAAALGAVAEAAAGAGAVAKAAAEGIIGAVATSFDTASAPTSAAAATAADAAAVEAEAEAVAAAAAAASPAAPAAVHAATVAMPTSTAPATPAAAAPAAPAAAAPAAPAAAAAPSAVPAIGGNVSFVDKLKARVLPSESEGTPGSSATVAGTVKKPEPTHDADEDAAVAGAALFTAAAATAATPAASAAASAAPAAPAVTPAPATGTGAGAAGVASAATEARPRLTPRSPASFRPSERSVPASPLARVLGFGGIAARLAAGALTDRVTAVGSGSSSSSSGSSGGGGLGAKQMERLVDGLCRMRGAALKIGQMLSIQDESLLPPALAAAMARVRQGADVMPQKQLEAVMAGELGQDWRTRLFAEFEDSPIAAASIGQVHRAALPSGALVAVKVQYPGVARSITSDVDNLSRLLTVIDIAPKGLYLGRAMESAKAELTLECDYTYEAAAQKHFASLIAAEPVLGGAVKIPQVVDGASGLRVLTTELVRGVPIDHITALEDVSTAAPSVNAGMTSADGFRNAPSGAPSAAPTAVSLLQLSQAERDRVGTLLMRVALRELFSWRFMQTDPNWANFLYDAETRTLSLIDFGASRRYPKPFVDEYLKMVRACGEGDDAGIVAASRKIGFLTGDESAEMVATHIQSAKIIGEPFGFKGAYDFRLGNISGRVAPLAGKMVHDRLAPPPMEVYTLHRKLSGAFLTLKRLGAVVDVNTMFKEITDEYVFGPESEEDAAITKKFRG